MGNPEVETLLTMLANEGQVSPATHRQHGASVWSETLSATQRLRDFAERADRDDLRVPAGSQRACRLVRARMLSASTVKENSMATYT